MLMTQGGSHGTDHLTVGPHPPFRRGRLRYELDHSPGAHVPPVRLSETRLGGRLDGSPSEVRGHSRRLPFAIRHQPEGNEGPGLPREDDQGPGWLPDGARGRTSLYG